MDGDTADRIAARATAFGCGLIVFMITWIMAARVTTYAMAPPASAYFAMGAALVAGAATAAMLGRRLVIAVQRHTSAGDFRVRDE